MKENPMLLTAMLESYVRTEIGTPSGPWPGHWPQDIEAAVIEAVFSLRSGYGSHAEGRESGPYAAAQRWKYRADDWPWVADDLEVLAAETEADVLDVVENRGMVAGRRKAAIAIDAAGALAAVGVLHASDLASHESEARDAWLAVRGCGPVTWRYLRVLLGQGELAPDEHVLRFLHQCVPLDDPDDASVLLTAAAERLSTSPLQLEHAIWNHARRSHARRKHPPAFDIPEVPVD